MAKKIWIGTNNPLIQNLRPILPKNSLAWIPIANIFLLLMIAKRPLWWFILMLIPLVNIVVAIIVWLDILKLRGKPWWWIILLIIPIVNLVALAILAWGK